MDVSIGGYVEPGFAAVKDAFSQNFEAGHETGAAFCLHVGGRKVVDLYGGTFDGESRGSADGGGGSGGGSSGAGGSNSGGDSARARAYDQDTLQLVFSSTKGATAACANLLEQRGELDVASPVSRYWPEFAQSGKEEIPVLFLLSHQAGLPAADVRLSPAEVQAWEPVIAALEAQSPLWEPGTAHGYHALTYGWLVGELVRRITGRTLGTYFAEEIAGPLGLEFWIGLPGDHEDRVSPIIGSVVPGGDLPGGDVPGGLGDRAGGQGAGDGTSFSSTLLARALNFAGAFSDPGWANARAWHAAEVPAANGITNAASLSRLYAGLIGTVEGGPAEPILTKDQVDRARTVRTFGADLVFASVGFTMKQHIGQGFWVSSPFSPFGGAGSFGHTGAGGSYGFADPENGLAVGYVMNRMSTGMAVDPRSRPLLRACYEAVGAAPKYI
jgi:CubicO group peptidase (beta-lactamase class C family)